MSTEAKGDGKRDAVGAGEQEAAASVSSAAAEIPVADSVAGQAGETGPVTAADEASGVTGASGASGASEDADDEEGGHQDDDDDHEGDEGDEGDAGEPEDGEGDDDYDYDYDYDGDKEVTDGLDDDEAGPPAEPIEFAEPVELDEPAAGPRAPRRWTRVLIAVGFLVVAAAIVGGAIAIVGSVTHGFKKPVKVTYKKSAVFSLKTGNCFNPSGDAYTLVSCDVPHQAEVFATFALPGAKGTKWPGTTATAAAASSGCATRLSGYLNPQLAVSLASTYVYPDATAWQAGTRTVICEVRAASGDLTGSVRGAGGAG